MRFSWAHATTGALLAAVLTGMLILPGHLLGPDRRPEVSLGPAGRFGGTSLEALPPVVAAADSPSRAARRAPTASRAAVGSAHLVGRIAPSVRLRAPARPSIDRRAVIARIAPQAPHTATPQAPHTATPPALPTPALPPTAVTTPTSPSPAPAPVPTPTATPTVPQPPSVPTPPVTPPASAPAAVPVEHAVRVLADALPKLTPHNDTQGGAEHDPASANAADAQGGDARGDDAHAGKGDDNPHGQDAADGHGDHAHGDAHDDHGDRGDGHGDGSHREGAQ
jgi:hypothetical protein